MPEAAIHEDSNSLARKGEVRFAGKLGMSAPAGDSGSTQQLGKGLLCACVVSRPDARHIVRPLSGGEPIHHEGLSFLLAGPDSGVFVFKPL
jgi:hypothetical protein